MDKDQREQIGFQFIMDKLEITTVYGVEEKKKIQPFRRSEKQNLILELNSVEKVVKSLEKKEKSYKEIGRVFCKSKDIRNSLKRCRALSTLDDVELYEIKYCALLIEELIQSYEELEIQITGVEFHSLEKLVEILDPEKKRMPTFYVYDSYSQKLRDIRGKKNIIEERIVLEDNEIQAIKLKEQRLQCIVEEEEEEGIIRGLLTKEIFQYIPALEKNIGSIGRLDFLIAKAKLALSLDAIQPEINDEMEIFIKDSVNPEVVEILSARDRKFTPVSISLKKGTTVITGANMGGKSVTLKTIVLNLMLGQMGFFVFCKQASFPILDFLYFISDDMQNISQGLSTFGAEIIKLKEVIEHTKKEVGFIALDEFARGTNPKEGFYLVKSLCKYLNSWPTISLISTHYDGVVEEDMTHYQVIGLKNINFEDLKYKIDLNKKHSVEIIQEHMEYSLEKVSKGSEVPKDAFNIAVLLGLDEALMQIAKGYYTMDKK